MVNKRDEMLEALTPLLALVTKSIPRSALTEAKTGVIDALENLLEREYREGLLDGQADGSETLFER